MAKATRVNPAPTPTQAPAAPLVINPAAPTPAWLWAVLGGGLALVYFFWSTRSNGFYQQDEAGHFLSMLDFWGDPKAILGNWAKFGYKLLYVLTAKAGHDAVTLQNCVLAAGAAVLAGLALQAQGSRYGLAALLLVGLQPLYISLSFRNYSEIPTAFLVALAYYLHVRHKPLLSMLCVSYICTIRQEFYPILGLYGLVLLYRKQWVAAFAGAVFPLVQNFYGAYLTDGDPLYLYKQITGQAGAIADVWVRQGGEHYFKTSMVIFGPIAVTLVVHYLVWGAMRRHRLDLYLAVPSLLFFGLQVLFNLTTVEIGPSTGGNLRYMLMISPLVGMMGALGLEQFAASKQKVQALYYLVPLLVLTVAYLNHKSDLLKLTEEKDGTPALGVLMAGLLLYWSGGAQARTWALAGCMALLAVFTVRPIKRTEEEKTMAEAARWFQANRATYQGKQLYVDNSMFFYFQQNTRADFTPKPYWLNSDNVLKAQPGDLVIWDSHYSYRPKLNPKALTYEYFANRPQEWRLVQQLVTPDQTFGVLMFERIKN